MHGCYGSWRTSGNRQFRGKSHDTIHSCVQQKNGERLVGQAAKRQAVTNPANTIFSAKRLIGANSEIKDEVANLPYKVIEGKWCGGYRM